MVSMYDFSGLWRSKYRVLSGAGAERKLIETEHDVTIYRHGNHLVVESLPNEDQDGPYLLARFTLDGSIATGTYHSENSPKSAAKKAIYYGATQLIMDEDGNALRGMGVGFGRDMQVKSSEWELVRVPNNIPSAPTRKQATKSPRTHRTASHTKATSTR
jgi:hypothetical protein